jgi:hypothetical protein
MNRMRMIIPYAHTHTVCEDPSHYRNGMNIVGVSQYARNEMFVSHYVSEMCCSFASHCTRYVKSDHQYELVLLAANNYMNVPRNKISFQSNQRTFLQCSCCRGQTRLAQ